MRSKASGTLKIRLRDWVLRDSLVTHVISSFLEQLGTVITKGVQGKTKLLKVKHALSETRQAIAPGCDLLWHDHWRAL